MQCRNSKRDIILFNFAAFIGEWYVIEDPATDHCGVSSGDSLRVTHNYYLPPA